MPASVIHVRRAQTATRTRWAEKPSAPVRPGTRDPPATKTSMSARSVRITHDRLERTLNAIQFCITILFAFQVRTHVSMADGVSTLKAHSSASVFKVMKVHAVRWTSTSASRTPARTTPPASTRLVDSTASACQVRVFDHWPASKAHHYCWSDGLLWCAGYEGVFCQINTDDCASQPCLNNGKCIDKINSFHCECPKGDCSIIIFKDLIIKTSNEDALWVSNQNKHGMHFSLQGSLGICVRWMWTSVPAHRVKMVLNAQTDPTNTPANALQVHI